MNPDLRSFIHRVSKETPGDLLVVKDALDLRYEPTAYVDELGKRGRHPVFVFENLKEPSAEMVQEIRDATSRLLPQMKCSARCQADAIGILSEINTDAMTQKLAPAALPKKAVECQPYIAVSSTEGVMINQHLGEAERFLIFGMNETGKCILIGARKAPRAGGGEQRWKELAKTLKDCCTILVSGAGNSPKKVLNSHGIEVLVLEGVIKEIVSGIFSGQDLKELINRSPLYSSGSSCNGTGKKCG